MKKTFLFLLAIIGSLISYAGNPIDKISIKKNTAAVVSEDGGNKLSIGLSVGTTIPLQNFGDKTNNPDTTHFNGYANTGIHFNATFGYKFSKYVGAMVMAGGSINSFNTTSFTAANGGFGGATTSAKSHYVGQYLMGPYLSVPIGNKFSVEVRALVGLVTSSYPKIIESTSGSFGTYSYGFSSQTKINSAAAFGFSAGVGVKYMVADHFGMTLNAAYAGSNMGYKGYTSTTTTTPFTGTTTSNVTDNTTKRTMSIGMINITAGVAYCF